jgi:hypothetical protein
MARSRPSSSGILPKALRLAGGLSSADLPRVVEALSQLETHLARWAPERVDLQISVKDRGGPEQRVTLEAKLGPWPLLVATASDADLDRALFEVRKQLIREIEDERRRRTPKDNRTLRTRPQPESPRPPEPPN